MNDARARRGRLTAAFAINHQRSVAPRLEYAAAPSGRKPAIGRILGRKVARQEASGNAASHEAENRVDDLTQMPGKRAVRPVRRRKQR